MKYKHPDGKRFLDDRQIDFLKACAGFMGKSITWQSIAARPQSKTTKHLLMYQSLGRAAEAAVKDLALVLEN